MIDDQPAPATPRVTDLQKTTKWTSGTESRGFSPVNATTTISKVPGWLAALGLLLLTLVVYIPSTQCGFIWDDDYYVEKNETLGAGDGLHRVWFEFEATNDYYPLTFTTFWLEYWLWGLRPFGYHLTNVLLHAVNVIFLWRLLVRLGVPGALLAAALFAVHPVHVESVAWVTERKNMLSGLFCLLSLHAFVSFARLDDSLEDSVDDPVGIPGARHWRYLVLSVGAFALAMLAKTAVIPLPLIMPVLVWWKHGRLRLGELLAVAPYFLVASPLFIAAFISEANFAGAGVNIFATEGSVWNLTFLERLLLCGRVLWFYVAKLLWPHPLIFVYPRWQIDSHVWWQYLYPLAAVAVPLILWRLRNRIGRGPLAAALVFGLMLAPASGFFNFYFQRHSYVSDHLQYFASIALTTLLAAVASHVLKKFPTHRVWGISLAMILVFVLAVQSWRQQSAYRDKYALWTDTVAKNPDAWLAHNNLAAMLQPQGKIKEAVVHSRQAVRINPADYESHYNLGNGLQQLGRLDEAVAHYQAALNLAPEFVEARHNLATTLARLGRLEEAAQQYHLILRMNSHYFKAHNGLGIVLVQQKRIKEAVESFRDALRLQPDSSEAQNNLRRAQRLLKRRRLEGKNDD